MKIPREDAFRLMHQALKDALPFVKVAARTAKNSHAGRSAARLLIQINEALQEQKSQSRYLPGRPKVIPKKLIIQTFRENLPSPVCLSRAVTGTLACPCRRDLAETTNTQRT